MGLTQGKGQATLAVGTHGGEGGLDATAALPGSQSTTAAWVTAGGGWVSPHTVHWEHLLSLQQLSQKRTKWLAI